MPIDQAALGQRLRDARTNSGLTQDEVAEELGIPRTAIVHIESGNRNVGTLELANFARLYRRPIADFFRDAASEEDVLTAIGRIDAGLEDNPAFQQELERHVNLCQHGVTLRSMLAFETRNSPPEYALSAPPSIWEAVQQGTTVAEEERRRLAIGNNPIPDMADLITAEGIWASGAMLPDEVSGMFLRHSSIGMVILVNYNHRRARKRFSYAHEYAHALFDRTSAVTISRLSDRDELSEVRANAFAAAFLMPETGVHEFLASRNKCQSTREAIPVYDAAPEAHGAKVQATFRAVPGSQQVNFQLVARMAHHFGVSYQAACYRLRGLKCIEKNELPELLAKDEQALHFLEILRMKEDLEGLDDEQQGKLDRELASELLGLAVEAYSRELISKAKLVEVGQLLDIKSKDMLELVQP